jgi:hypothetical protein
MQCQVCHSRIKKHYCLRCGVHEADGTQARREYDRQRGYFENLGYNVDLSHRLALQDIEGCPREN